MSEVISIEQLAEEFEIPEAQVMEYLSKSKAKPIRVKIGIGEIILYTPTVSRRVVRAGMVADVRKAKEAKEAAEKPVEVFVATLESTPEFSGKEFLVLQEGIRSLKRDVVSLMDMFKALSEVFRGTTTCILSLRDTMEVHDGVATSEFAGMRNMLENLRDASVGTTHPSLIRMGSATPPVPPVPAETPTTTGPIPRVGVVGLFQQHHTALQKEFEGMLNLTILNPDEGRKVKNLKNMDAVFALVKHIGHHHMDSMVAAGIDPRPLNGTLSELRDVLHNYIETERLLALCPTC